MEVIISAVVVIFVVIWAIRIETGLNKLNATAERIEKHFTGKTAKKESK
jgi:hypothetical protein